MVCMRERGRGEGNDASKSGREETNDMRERLWRGQQRE